MLPTVDFCGLTFTRLLIGANPFGGFSHQNPARDQAMRSWHTPERIIETWNRAAAAGINTFVSNNETPHVIQSVETYLKSGAPLQWVAQLSNRCAPSMQAAVDRAIEIGAKAAFFHGGIVDSLNLVDFHVVCFFDCGSLHAGRGDKFHLADIFPAAECCRRLQKPCIAYKIMGAGRLDPAMAFEFAFSQIKPGDVVNVGMHRGDKDDIVEENVAMVQRLLAPAPTTAG